MSSYSDTAWGYDEESLGLDPETKSKKFVPSEEELKLFKEEKANMYKGTWMICLVYGISAISLLAVVFLTDWGKEYVYNKFLPAVLTYVIGAIIIIIYLVLSIFALQPRKARRGFDVMPVCPDYWKLENISDERKNSIIDNNVKYDGDGRCPNHSTEIGEDCTITVNPNDEYSIKDSSGKKDVVSKNSQELNHKCVPDPMVFGSIVDYRKMNKNLYNNNLFMASEYNNSDEAKTKQLDGKLGGSGGVNSADLNEDKMLLEKNAKFLYRESEPNKTKPDKRQYITGYDASDELLKYARLTGAYKTDWKRPASGTPHTPFGSSLFVDQQKTYEKHPLICNEVYPDLLDKLEKDGKDDLKCELAKTCGISWSKLDCYPNNVE